mgnify:CR=1 FL=1
MLSLPKPPSGVPEPVLLRLLHVPRRHCASSSTPSRIDRVVLGTDYPAPMVQEDPVGWLEKVSGISGVRADGDTGHQPGAHAGPVDSGALARDTEITSPVR